MAVASVWESFLDAMREEKLRRPPADGSQVAKVLVMNGAPAKGKGRNIETGETATRAIGGKIQTYRRTKYHEGRDYAKEVEEIFGRDLSDLLKEENEQRSSVTGLLKGLFRSRS